MEVCLTITTPPADIEGASLRLHFDDNAVCAQLFGQHHANIARLEQKLPVRIDTRGNEVLIQGDSEQDVASAARVLKELYARLVAGHDVDRNEIDGIVRLTEAKDAQAARGGISLTTERRAILPRTANQAVYVRAMERSDLVFGVGPAGTGKTYLAVAAAVAAMKARRVERLVLSRPAVEAGERLGFLPGDLKDKIDPYLRPLYDALHDMLPEGKLQQRIETGQIEIAPLAFMRGRTLSNAFVILDEAQNTSVMQMKMLLTRLGENSRMVITGDPSQVDLPAHIPSGLTDAILRLRNVSEIGMVQFDRSDVVRHPLVAKIIDAYEPPSPTNNLLPQRPENSSGQV